jgi:hypothetical protein
MYASDLLDGTEVKKKQTPKAQIYKTVASIVERDPLDIVAYGEFPRKFITAADEQGTTILLEVMEDDSVRQASQETLENEVMRFTDTLVSKSKDFNLTPKDAKDSAKTWRMLHQPVLLDTIAALKEKSDPGLCWKRLPFDLNVEGPTPQWDFLLSHTEQKEIVMMWIGSTFITNSSREQWLWMYGNGDDGKGTILEFLYDIYGDAYTPGETNHKGNKHWKANFLGKRIVGFADCSDTKFFTSDTMKSLTGDSYHVIDPKGEKPYTARLDCKFIAASNKPLELGAGKADVKRALIASFRTIEDGQLISKQEVLRRLREEAPAFLTACKKLYLEKRTHNDRIPMDLDLLEVTVANKYEVYEAIFEKYFILDQGGEIRASELQEFYMSMRTQNLKLHDTRIQGEFKEFLRLEKQITIGTPRVHENGKTFRRITYRGLRFSENFNLESDEI